MSHESLSDRVSRSLTLLRPFVVASALLLGLAAVVIGTILTHAIRDQALEDAKVDVTQYTNGVLSSQLLRDSKLVIRKRLPDVIERDLNARPDIISVKVWRRAGGDREPERDGRGEGPLHRRPLAARPGHRAGGRGRTWASIGTGSNRSGSPACCTTSASSPCPTRSTRS